MVRTAVGFLALLVLLPALQARDKPEKQTPAQRYQALVKEYENAEMEFRKAVAKVENREDQQKKIQKEYPPDKFAPLFLELAEKNPKEPATVDALAWIVSHGTRKPGPHSPRIKAIQILLRDHVQSEKMAAVCQALRFFGDGDSPQLLRAVLKKNKHRSVQGQACFSLAQQAENRLRFVRQCNDNPDLAKRYEAIAGKEAAEALVKEDPDKLSKEAEAFFERTVKDFADVPDSSGDTLGEWAKDKLDALRHPISVGKPAPEIQGEDIDGKKFKLSDYRGKVVLLDFWGHW